MEIIMATSNRNKVREIREMLKETGIEIIPMKEAGVEIDIEETGSTFEENSIIKAETIAGLTGKITVADDSGLSIDALDGAPGIYSARYMGENTPYPEKNQAILKKMKDVPKEKRGARFTCVICIAEPAETGIQSKTFTGIMEGEIGYEMRGDNGFGYDPIFLLPEYGRTSAELSLEEKNDISHRGRALRLAVDELKKKAGH